jgi:hypothetical protein
VQPISGRAVNGFDEALGLVPQPVIQKTRAIVKTKSSRRLEIGDLVCAHCGEGNLPARHFCSRCGEELETAGVVQPVWWRRLFRRRRKRLALGTRPGQKGTAQHRRRSWKTSFRRFRYIMVFFVVLLTLAYAFYPPFQATVRDNVAALFRTVQPTLQPVHPVQDNANVMAAGHPPQYLADEYTDTYWSSPWDKQTRVTLTFQFSSDILLRSIILRSGVADQFVAHGRPSILQVSFPNGKQTTLTPQDSPDAQTLSLNNATLVHSVTLRILDIYDGQKATDVAISEIEFYALK